MKIWKKKINILIVIYLFKDFTEIRCAVVGNVDAGKSTLLGVLTHGELDNGRGLARQRLFRHKHEAGMQNLKNRFHRFYKPTRESWPKTREIKWINFTKFYNYLSFRVWSNIVCWKWHFGFWFNGISSESTRTWKSRLGVCIFGSISYEMKKVWFS